MAVIPKQKPFLKKSETTDQYIEIDVGPQRAVISVGKRKTELNEPDEIMSVSLSLADTLALAEYFLREVPENLIRPTTTP